MIHEDIMDTRTLGNLWPVSALTLGGGGIGQVWGPTEREEAVATVREAVESGITLLDVAPSYGDGEAELVVGEAFGGALPDGVRVCTKAHNGHIDPAGTETAMAESLEASLRRLELSYVDLFVFHSQILPFPDPERPNWTAPLDLFESTVRPLLERWVEEGRIGAWGVTAVQFPQVVDVVFGSDPPPGAAQMVANILDSPGDLAWTDDLPDYRAALAAAKDRGIGTMGIRVVQAGAFADTIDRPLDVDHPAIVDYERAAPFRQLAAEFGESAASLAHRYALSMPDVDTVVLGIKNREELTDCVSAAEAGPLRPDELAAIDTAIRDR